MFASSGGNQRETDRARAQARQAKLAGAPKEKNTEKLKRQEADAEAMRLKQQKALEKKAAEEKAKLDAARAAAAAAKK